MDYIVKYVKDGKVVTKLFDTVDEGRKFLSGIPEDQQIGIFTHSEIVKATERTMVQSTPTSLGLSGTMICPICGQRHTKDDTPQVKGCVKKVIERVQTHYYNHNLPYTEVWVNPQQYKRYNNIRQVIKDVTIKLDIDFGIRGISPRMVIMELEKMCTPVIETASKIIDMCCSEIKKVFLELPAGPFEVHTTDECKHWIIDPNNGGWGVVFSGNIELGGKRVWDSKKFLYYPREYKLVGDDKTVHEWVLQLRYRLNVQYDKTPTDILKWLDERLAMVTKGEF